MIIDNAKHLMTFTTSFSLTLSFLLCAASTSAENAEFEANVPPISINLRQFHGSLHLGKGETDSNCWSSPSGQGFMIRGKNYLKDSSKV